MRCPPSLFPFYQDLTRHLFFVQIKQSILSMQLYCSPEASVLLASYAVQAMVFPVGTEASLLLVWRLPRGRECPRTGQTAPEECHRAIRHERGHVEGEDQAVVDEQPRADQVGEEETDRRTCFREEAEMEYLRVAQDLEMYGVLFYPICVRRSIKIEGRIDFRIKGRRTSIWGYRRRDWASTRAATGSLPGHSSPGARSKTSTSKGRRSVFIVLKGRIVISVSNEDNGQLVHQLQGSGFLNKCLYPGSVHWHEQSLPPTEESRHSRGRDRLSFPYFRIGSTNESTSQGGATETADRGGPSTDRAAGEDGRPGGTRSAEEGNRNNK